MLLKMFQPEEEGNLKMESAREQKILYSALKRILKE